MPQCQVAGRSIIYIRYFLVHGHDARGVRGHNLLAFTCFNVEEVCEVEGAVVVAAVCTIYVSLTLFAASTPEALLSTSLLEAVFCCKHAY